MCDKYHGGLVVKVYLDSLSPPQIIAHQAPLSMEILHPSILEWVDISWPRDQTHVSCIGRHILYCSATREAHVW